MYKLAYNSETIIRIEDGACIPPDPANTDYAAYLKWVEEGNTAEPADVPPPPVELTPAQKLEAAGLSVDELKQLLGLTK